MNENIIFHFNMKNKPYNILHDNNLEMTDFQQLLVCNFYVEKFEKILNLKNKLSKWINFQNKSWFDKPYAIEVSAAPHS